MSFTITEANELDIEECVKIAKTRELLLPNGKYPDSDYLREILGKVFFFIGKHSGKVVGFIIGQPLVGRSCFIDLLAVSKEHRGKGYGTKLLEYLIKKCRENNINYLFLFASITNSDTLNFYKKNGLINSPEHYSFFCKEL